ncbi:MAG: hypothetical protein KI793_24070 [Rivularia sp. (in: Bacteria)]|nr:hypothetical protein [Rivularia sp. MS3]
MTVNTENESPSETIQTLPNVDTNEITAVQIGLAVIPVVFVITLAFLFFKQLKYRKELYTQAVNLKRLSSIPCYKCQFFSNNQQLPCAVQPALVLSEEAFNCSDYSSRKRR